MIKSEVISDRAISNKGWSDQHRTTVSPLRVSIIIVIAAIAALVFGVVQKNSDTDTGSSSQPAVSAKPLTVKPVSATTYQAANGTATVQSPTGDVSESEANASALNTTTSTQPSSSFDQQKSSSQKINQ